jgi:hypothetical protein
MLDYDLVGFHVLGFLDNYVYACRRLFGATWDGFHLRVEDRVQRAAAYPVGIDPTIFRPPDGPRSSVAKRELLGADASNLAVVLGVDRLDYTKGIPERIRAFEAFLRASPAWRKRVLYVQVAAPSRTELPGYRRLKGEVESLAGRVNGELGEHDWTPVRYLYRSYERDFLARLYAEADVGLITPLRDGMNLVAEEYVAAQHESDPGVLVLSRLAGAAQILKSASLRPMIAQITTLPDYTFRSSTREHHLVNTNRLCRFGVFDVKAGKTGHINEAGYCLATWVSTQSRDVLAVVLGASSNAGRFAVARRLIDKVAIAPVGAAQSSL